jgi:hypothetical protein
VVTAALAVVAAAARLVWYLASPLVLTQRVSETVPAQVAHTMLITSQLGVVDAIHKGAGTASILRLPDGQRFTTVFSTAELAA